MKTKDPSFEEFPKPLSIVLFDTETTGLLQPIDAPMESQPKITELYMVKINQDFKMLDEYNQMFSVGEPLTEEVSRITGITDSDLKGKPAFKEQIPLMREFLKNVDLLVAHNLAFDLGMLDVEFKRAEKEFPRMPHNCCTVLSTMGMTGHRLSLSRLHWMLFQKQFSAHRAKDDVFALVRCFHELTEKGVITFDDYR